jgi:hypothetical protein
VRRFAWGIDKMGHIFMAHFTIFGPIGGQIIQKYRKMINFNDKSIFLYVFGKILCKKNIDTLNSVLLIFFSEFVILFPHDLTLSLKCEVKTVRAVAGF